MIRSGTSYSQYIYCRNKLQGCFAFCRVTCVPSILYALKYYRNHPLDHAIFEVVRTHNLIQQSVRGSLLRTYEKETEVQLPSFTKFDFKCGICTVQKGLPNSTGVCTLYSLLSLLCVHVTKQTIKNMHLSFFDTDNCT